jgi:hypothetical protein
MGTIMATLWAESVDEADELLAMIGGTQYNIDFEDIFVAKRHGQHRTNDYLAGKYYKYYPEIGLRDSDVSEQVAPNELIRAVQWTSMDVYITEGEKLIFSAEVTTQLEGNNIFQRLPRAAMACSTGSVVVTLQSSGSKPSEMMFQRLYSAHDRINSSCHAITTDVEECHPSVVLYYDDEESQAVAIDLYVSLIAACVNNQKGAIATILGQCQERMRPYILPHPFPVSASETNGKASVKCFEVDKSKVKINMNVNPDKKSWRDKGTGQMDPYVGLIYAAALLHAYDENGNKVRDVVANFRRLPPSFWWLLPKNGSLYRVLPSLFCDDWEFGISDKEGKKYITRPGKCGSGTCHCC